MDQNPPRHHIYALNDDYALTQHSDLVADAAGNGDGACGSDTVRSFSGVSIML